MIKPSAPTLKLSKVNINSSLFDPSPSSQGPNSTHSFSPNKRLKYSYSPAINKTIAKRF